MPTPLLAAATTSRIINAFYRVYDELGYGFLESVYSGAFEIELKRHELIFVREAPIDVVYHGQRIGHYRADFLANEEVVVETKAGRALNDADSRQLLNMLRATRIEVGMLLHFGPKATFKRMIFENGRKQVLEEVH
ncbi:MAG TPA: GxxExxY protein [Gemmatimonadaceae bacterium]|nr:GxxExxY protein [Gemmatimonadaceae bacterium]